MHAECKQCLPSGGCSSTAYIALLVLCPQVPKVWAFLAMTVLLGVVALPVMVVLQTGHAVGMWLLLPLMLGVTGALGGVMTTIGPQIYPPAVRASGYNIGHNL